LICLCLPAILVFKLLNQKGLLLFSPDFIILLFLGSLSAFVILYAPFMATRHVLLIIPFFLLFAHEQIHSAGFWFNRLSILLSCFLGLALGISDWMYADYYRQMAARIVLKPGVTTWTA